MQESRTQNATRNIFWGIIEKITYLLLPFVLRTVFIYTLGKEYLGLNSLFSSILSVLSVTELGFGSAISFSMYNPIAEGDNDMVCALLNAFKKIYRVVGSIILVAGLAIMPWLPNLIKGSYPADINIYILYLVFLINTALGYFLAAYKAVLFSAHQRNDLTSKRTTLINIFSNTLKLVVLLTIKNYYVYTLVLPIATIASNLTNAYLAKKMFPQIECRGTLSKESKHGIKKRVVGLLSFKIYGVIFSSVDAIVISAFLGLVPLAIYNNYYYIQSTLVGFLVVLTTSITAGIGNKMVTASKEENYEDFKKVVFINGWLSSWCSICMFCLYQHFITLWVGEEMLFPFDTMLLMVIYFFIPRISTISYTYREAAGLWWEDRIRPIVATVANLVINLLLVNIIGMNGVLISTIICSVFINIPWGSYVLFKNYFKCSPMEYFGVLIYYVAVTAIVCALTYLLIMLLPTTGFISFAAKAIICTIVPNLLFCAIYHKKSEYGYFKSYILRLLKVKR